MVKGVKGSGVQLMVSSSSGSMSWKAVAVLERVVALKRVIALRIKGLEGCEVSATGGLPWLAGVVHPLSRGSNS